MSAENGAELAGLSQIKTWQRASAMNLAVANAGTAGQCRQRFRQWNDAWVADRELPNPLPNFAVPLRPIVETNAKDMIGRFEAFFGETGSPWILWSSWPGAALEPLGYEIIGQPPLMVRPPGAHETPLPAGLRIEEARDDRGLAVFERTFIEGYGLTNLQPVRTGSMFGPGALAGPVRFWVGFADREPVTVAASCSVGGVVGIYAVATMEHARGRGFGAAVTNAAAGIDPKLPVVLQSSDAGYLVYQRLGFHEVSRYELWMKTGTH